MKPLRYVLALLMAALACFTNTRAIEDSIEITVGSQQIDSHGSDADTLDDTGTAYSVSWDHPFSKMEGRFSGHVLVERSDAYDNGDLGAYNVNLGARVNIGDLTTLDGDPLGRIRAYVETRAGVVFMDTLSQTQEVTISDGEESVTAQVESDTAPRLLGLSGVAGLRVYFDERRTFGGGVEIAYGLPVGDSIDIDKTTTVRVLMVLPVSRPQPVASGGAPQ